MISTSWSTPESPGNIGWPNNNSATTHPALHTSMTKMYKNELEYLRFVSNFLLFIYLLLATLASSYDTHSDDGQIVTGGYNPFS